MDSAMRKADIDRTLRKEKYCDTREKLHKLLVERQIPYLSSSSTNKMEVIETIGSGSYGVVQLVRYEQRIYAHKSSLRENAKQRISIIEEAIKLTDITEYHPNIQRVYFINLKTSGFLMDYCCGGSLEAYVLDSKSTYTFVDALNWSYQLADALSFLHSKNTMHRDVKMQNILLKDNYHTVVLTDYGTATQLGRSVLTREVGTPIIMAPEVCSSSKYTEQCDIYSWAIVFNQLLAKQHDPYGDPALNSFDLLMKVSKDKFRPRSINNCPKLLVALMYRSWHSDPSERPSLAFIKKVLRFLLNILPEDGQKCSEEMISANKKQWVNECNSSEQYLLNEPRLNNERSMDIYLDCSRTVKNIVDIKKDITEIEDKLATCLRENEVRKVHHAQLLADNKKLQKEIEVLRAKKRPTAD